MSVWARVWPWLLLAWCLCLAGCRGSQHVLDPRGPLAGRTATLIWIALIGGIVIFIGVMLLLWIALERGSNPVAQRLSDRGGWILVGISGVAVPVVVLGAFLIYSGWVGNVNAKVPPPDHDLVIEVVGHRWWWDFRYKTDPPSQGLRVSNEFHIPTGVPVRLELKSLDVIHSFWVPNLHGKMDLVPGKTNVLTIQADEPGVYRGQCAEFCGLQHALMGFVVVAEPPEQYQAWMEAQRLPAPEPITEAQSRGQQVFLERSCGLCHAIRGTIAMAAVAPDLTHIASRRTLAAATVPNTRGHLGGWIIDSHGIKPGNHMPPNQLSPEDLNDLLTYLESLQ
jgi:cytochrome c oxidase subunit II